MGSADDNRCADGNHGRCRPRHAWKRATAIRAAPIGSERPTDGPPNRYRRLAYRPVGTGAHRSQERGRPPRPATIQSLPGDRPTGLTARYGAWHATGATTGTAADVERHATPSGHPGKFPSSQKWNERQSRSDFAKLSAWYFFGRSLYPAKSHDERQRLNLIGLPST